MPFNSHVTALSGLCRVITESDQPVVVILTDAEGIVLWRYGSRNGLVNADAIGFVEGAGWGDHDVGTNAIGRTLATGAPVSMRGYDHFAYSHGLWDCQSSPIRNPLTGLLIGALDISTPAGTSSVEGRGFVDATSRLLETMLLGAAPVNKGSKAHLRLFADPPQIQFPDGRQADIPLNMAEILSLLILQPGGCSADELAFQIGGDKGQPGAIRTQIHRLRVRLGDIIQSGPYRIESSEKVDSDLHRALNALERGDHETVLDVMTQPLLKRSPIVDLRTWAQRLAHLTDELVIRAGSPQQQARWKLTRMSFDDAWTVS
ncbi:helix-turn-helix domain-containing protein [Kocuria gwangalliensis]